MTGVLIEKGNLDIETHTEGGQYKKTLGETSHPQAKESNLGYNPYKKPVLLTPCFLTSSLQSCVQ